jgi:sulfonate transport system substrate-binding protein
LWPAVLPSLEIDMRLSFTLLAAAACALIAMASAARAERLRVGVQKYGTLIVLQTTGNLDKRLAAEGITVEWKEFPGGPQLLEALAAGSLDFGTTGDAPPVFSQAAGSNVVYIGVEPAAPKGEAILVPEESPIKSIADLKGKRVALNKGSNVHYLLVEALASANLKPADIQSIFLPPSDGRAAFESGRVDAWAIWDPFLAAAQVATKARILTDGTGLVENHQFYLASREYAKAHAAVLREVAEEIKKADAWAEGHQSEVLDLLSARTGIDKPSLIPAIARLGYGYGPITPSIVAAQQRIADTFADLNLIPHKIDVKEAVVDITTASR